MQGTIGAQTGAYLVYSDDGNTYLNGKGKVYLESGSSTGHPMVRLAGTDYTIVHTGNISSYAFVDKGNKPANASLLTDNGIYTTSPGT
jgi:hypothetical protein